MPRPVAAIVSFRLGGFDGVAVEARKWQGALVALGFEVHTVAGAGPVDRVVPGLGIDAGVAPTRSEIDTALADADVVVIENLCSLPLNEGAAAALAAARRGAPASCTTTTCPGNARSTAGTPRPPTTRRGRTSP